MKKGILSILFLAIMILWMEMMDKVKYMGDDIKSVMIKEIVILLGIVACFIFVRKIQE